MFDEADEEKSSEGMWLAPKCSSTKGPLVVCWSVTIVSGHFNVKKCLKQKLHCCVSSQWFLLVRMIPPFLTIDLFLFFCVISEFKGWLYLLFLIILILVESYSCTINVVAQFCCNKQLEVTQAAQKKKKRKIRKLIKMQLKKRWTKCEGAFVRPQRPVEEEEANQAGGREPSPTKLKKPN